MVTMDQKIAEYLNNWKINDWPIGNLILCIIALVLAIILCGSVGIEREWRGRSAGLRTHLLVGVASCLIMIISIYGFPADLSEKRDVARLVAQVVTGVGFLGAGVIMHRNGGGVKGLTTAATIWIVMAIGIACGSFNFILAIIVTALILIVLTTFKKLEERINKHNSFITVVVPSDTQVLDKILLIAKQFDGIISHLSTEMTDGEKKIHLTFQVSFGDNKNHINEYIAELQKQINAISIQVL